MKKRAPTPRTSRRRAPGAPATTAALRAENTALRNQQAATSEILRVISRSPRDVQPVFDAIVDNARRLLGARTAVVTRLEGDQIHMAAFTSTNAAADSALREFYPLPLSGASAHARAVRAVAPINVGDVEMDATMSPTSRQVARARGYRSMLVVPIVHGGEAVGTISVSRPESGAFTPAEIALLQTFADQAVIAIENVRLFTELRESNRELTKALEQQTATSDILRVISSSPTDVQPVFDAIASSAARLCDASFCIVFRFDGEMITVAADDGRSPGTLDIIKATYPSPPGRQSMAARAIADRRVISIADAQNPAAYPYEGEHQAERARSIGYRTILAVPMMRGDTAIGSINVARLEKIPFTDTEVELLKTFADQAVIAIENVRLFTELQATNRDLTTALDKQTATSDILRVISRSQTDLQPVFEAIVSSAVRLLRA